MNQPFIEQMYKILDERIEGISLRKVEHIRKIEKEYEDKVELLKSHAKEILQPHCEHPEDKVKGSYYEARHGSDVNHTDYVCQVCGKEWSDED